MYLYFLAQRIIRYGYQKLYAINRTVESRALVLSFGLELTLFETPALLFNIPLALGLNFIQPAGPVRMCSARHF